MTLILEFPPEVESEIQRRASELGQSVEDYIEATVLKAVTTPPKQRRVATGYGKFAGDSRTVDDFLTDRRAEAEAEEAAERRRDQYRTENLETK